MKAKKRDSLTYEQQRVALEKILHGNYTRKDENARQQIKRPIVPVKEGYLYKLKRNRKQISLSSWNKRYFALEKYTNGVGMLAYYSSSKRKSQGTRIVLDSIKAVRVFQGTQFQIESSERNFMLRAETEEAALQWVNVLEAYRRKLENWKNEQERPVSAASSNASDVSNTLSTKTDSLSLSPSQEIEKPKIAIDDSKDTIMKEASKEATKKVEEESTVPDKPIEESKKKQDKSSNPRPIKIPLNVRHGWTSPDKSVTPKYHTTDKVVAFGEPLYGIQRGGGRKSRTPNVKAEKKPKPKIIRGAGIKPDRFRNDFFKIEQAGETSPVSTGSSEIEVSSPKLQDHSELEMNSPSQFEDSLDEKPLEDSLDEKPLKQEKLFIIQENPQMDSIPKQNDESGFLLESTDSYGIPPPPPSAEEPKDLVDGRALFNAVKDTDIEHTTFTITEDKPFLEDEDNMYKNNKAMDELLLDVSDENDGAIDDSHVLPSLPSLDEQKEDAHVTESKKHSDGKEVGNGADKNWLEEDWDDEDE